MTLSWNLLDAQCPLAQAAPPLSHSSKVCNVEEVDAWTVLGDARLTTHGAGSEAPAWLKGDAIEHVMVSDTVNNNLGQSRSRVRRHDQAMRYSGDALRRKWLAGLGQDFFLLDNQNKLCCT